MDDINVDMI